MTTSSALNRRFCFSFCHSLWESAYLLVAQTGDLPLKRRGVSPAECSRPGRRSTSDRRALLGGFVTGHDFSRADKANQINGALAPEGSRRRNSRQPIPLFRSLFSTRGTLRASALLLVIFATVISTQAQKAAWRQATEAELSALLPARAPVEKEHIETESSTASGITDGKGHFIAGIVLITAGYSADGKYSHYLVVQSPISVDGIHLTSGDYVFGFSRDEEDTLSVRLYEALTGKPVGIAKATRIPGAGVVKSLRILPPGEKPLIQIGRFGIPYELLDK